MFEFLKNPGAIKEIVKLFFSLLKVMVKTGLARVIKESGSVEVFEYDGSLLVGLNADKPELVKDAISKLGDELKQLKLPTCSIDYDGSVLTVHFNEKHREEMERVVV